MGRLLNLFPRFSTYQIIALTFLGLIFCGTLLLMLPVASNTGQSLPFIDALFTATSASCVTGLVVVDTAEYFSTFGQMVIIFLIQLGGLGIMTFATLFSIAFGKKINLQERLRIQESLNQSEVEGVVRLCMRVVKYSLVIEFVFGTMLAVHFFPLFGAKGIYWGYWHAVSAFCNAGFDLMGGFRSLTMFAADWSVNLIITSLIILGSLGFNVMEDIISKRNFADLRLHSKIVLLTTLALIVVGTGAIWFMETGNADTLGSLTTSQQVLASYFQAVTPRTAGFNTLPIDKLHESTLFVIIMLMFVGASPASTGGGIKTTTLAVILMTTWNLVRGKEDLVIFNRRIEDRVIDKAFIILTIGVIWVCGGTFFISYFEDARFLNMFFEVMSAFATVGLSTGETQKICDASKIVLILTMFAGRVGVLTFAMALMNRHKDSNIKYPKERIMIG
ncbi:Ktr system potassium uptake protein B [bioreactor metagenome]|jgi:potassium uptake protein, TrkH family|uniref:Ktr system potassium uptake protein B n=1 Tax=bioreactor metagenome TaxID=1076179 RepID=A0A644VLC7_9ZZZZ|nr:TrkH family potassium uptake protein [Acidaminococcaceae bacterium]